MTRDTNSRILDRKTIRDDIGLIVSSPDVVSRLVLFIAAVEKCVTLIDNFFTPSECAPLQTFDE
jgi:hypothetical protein